MKAFFIRTLGCKVNQCDSQELRDGFLRLGYRESRTGEDSDVVVVNTCCVTRHADRKSRNAIREAVAAAAHRRSLVAVTGCYAGYDRSAIEKIAGVSAVFENSKKDKILAWAREYSGQEGPFSTTPCSFGSRTRAFLKVQDGCDNRCSYCVVPFVRGGSRSKSLPRVVREAEEFVKAGHQEIVLTGVNLGSYGRDLNEKTDLLCVIESLEALEGLKRIRLSSIEAQEITQGLIEKMARSKKLCPHLHIPFQSGDDDVLRHMNKRSRVEEYRRILGEAKGKIKDLAVTCDFIVGYPAETEKNFHNTLDFLKFVSPLRTHIFPFSRRRGVAVSGRDKDLASDIVKERFAVMKEEADRLGNGFRSAYLGKTLDVLFEKREAGEWQGYSQNYIKVRLSTSQDLANVILRVKPVSLVMDGMTGKPA